MTFLDGSEMIFQPGVSPNKAYKKKNLFTGRMAL